VSRRKQDEQRKTSKDWNKGGGNVTKYIGGGRKVVKATTRGRGGLLGSKENKKIKLGWGLKRRYVRCQVQIKEWGGDTKKKGKR